MSRSFTPVSAGPLRRVDVHAKQLLDRVAMSQAEVKQIKQRALS